jgi:glycerate 2-kinase
MGASAQRGGGPGPAARLLASVAREALASCDPAAAVKRTVLVRGDHLLVCGRPIHLKRRGRLLLIAYGKAAPAMLRGILERVQEAAGRRTVQGLVISPGGPDVKRLAGGRIRLTALTAEHPIPLRASFAAGRRALQFASRAAAADDVLFLASGGGSALMAAPLAPFLTASDKSTLHRLLLISGAPIGSINTVRKHLSSVKGGRLGAAARKAGSQTTLVLCDVDPERFEEVASGPSLPDRTTIGDMILAIDRSGIATAMPVRFLEAMRTGRIPETPKPRDPVFRRSRSESILSNRDLRNAAVRAGLTRGLPAEAVPTELTFPVESAVEMVARAIETAPPGTRLLVLGGEVLTVPSGPGEGGRAQEFALRLAVRMAGLGSRPWAFLALGSDGLDGSSPAAGAFVDATTLERARRARLEPAKYLRSSQTYRFFKRLNDDFTTGPTGTNLRDLYLLLTGPIAGTGEPIRPIMPGAQDPWTSRSRSGS